MCSFEKACIRICGHKLKRNLPEFICSTFNHEKSSFLQFCNSKLFVKAANIDISINFPVWAKKARRVEIKGASWQFEGIIDTFKSVDITLSVLISREGLSQDICFYLVPKTPNTYRIMN